MLARNVGPGSGRKTAAGSSSSPAIRIAVLAVLVDDVGSVVTKGSSITPAYTTVGIMMPTSTTVGL
jgi:hypothetical protein